MKRRMISILCLFSLLVGLCGCRPSMSNQPAQTTPNTAAPTTAPTVMQTIETTVPVTETTAPTVIFQEDPNAPNYYNELGKQGAILWETAIAELGIKIDQLEKEDPARYILPSKVSYLGYEFDAVVQVGREGNKPIKAIAYNITYEQVQDFEKTAKEALDIYYELREQLLAFYGEPTPQEQLGTNRLYGTKDEVWTVFRDGDKTTSEFWWPITAEDYGCYSVGISADKKEFIRITISFLMPIGAQELAEKTGGY